MKQQSLAIFDFDDTLAKTSTPIIIRNTRTNRERFISSETFTTYKLKPNEIYDFRNFNKLIKNATPIKQYLATLQRVAKHPNIRTTILTARKLAFPVRYWLKEKFGLEVYVVALGSADSNSKRDYIEQQILKGYSKILYIDDNREFINAVRTLIPKYPKVHLHIIQA